MVQGTLGLGGFGSLRDSTRLKPSLPAHHHPVEEPTDEHVYSSHRVFRSVREALWLRCDWGSGSNHQTMTEPASNLNQG